MPTMSKTWQFDPNRLNTDAASSQNAGAAAWLFQIKQFLTGAVGGATLGLWTVYYSCDSVTAGTAGDGVDRWASSANVVVGTTNGAAHSWCVLRSPVLPNGMRAYLLLEANTWNGASSIAGSAFIVPAKTAFTGGSTTVGPTSTDQFSGGISSTTLHSYFLTSAANRYMHSGLTTDGATMYFLLARQGSGIVEACWLFSLLAQPKGADQYPFYMFHNASTTGLGALVGGNTSGSPYLSQAGLSSPFNEANACRTFNGAALRQQIMVWPAIYNSTTISPATLTTTVNASDPIDTTYFDFPCYVGFGNTAVGGANYTAGGYQVRGVLPDFAIAPDQVAQGTVDGPGGSITSAKVGSLWVPTNAVLGM